ncbi:MAG: hypothetical protein VX278_07895 [Myxococcota bacterium]|nr:hypothetical protein [Myxococcota bacterium]
MLIKYNLDDKGTGHIFFRNRLLHYEKSPFQSIEISDLDILGRVLVLDGIIQLSRLDSARYHEALAHIPMSNLEAPQRALILGGGDGVLIYELLKYPDLTIDLVDIDQRVCDLSREYLTELNHGALDSPRANVYYRDALAFCRSCTERYDIIFADITDPHPDSPSNSLLGEDAIAVYKRLLRAGGILVAQTDNIQIAPQHAANVADVFGRQFQNVDRYGIVALSLSSLFSFVWASDTISIAQKTISVPTEWLSEERFDLCLRILDLA